MLLRRGHVGQERTAHTHHNTLYYKTVHIRNTVTAGEKDADTKSHPEVHNGKSPTFRRENRIGMDRTGVNRVGQGWTELGWVGLDRVGQGGAGLDGLDGTGLTGWSDWGEQGWVGLGWVGLDWTGLDRIGPDRIGMDRTGVNRVGLGRAGLDWADRTGLGWAGLDSSRNQAMTAPQQRHTTTHPSTKRSCNSSGSPSQMRPTMRPAAMSTERIRRSRSRSSSRRPAYL